jgi:hypothetical protein
MSPNFSRTLMSAPALVMVCAPEFMAVGLSPSAMNRFMHSNLHEVLFVT